MKRLTATLLVTLCLFLGAPRATAADLTPWTLQDANLSLSLPSELAVVTRDGIQSNPEVFETFGVDNNALQEILVGASAYLNGVAADASHEYMVIVVEPGAEQRFWNFNALSDNLLQEISKTIIKEMGKVGYQTAFEEVYRVGDVTYLVLYGSATQGGDDYRQYYTSVNGRMTSITMHSYTGPITDDQAALHRQVVDSATFLSIEPDPDPESDPSGFLSAVESLVLPVRIAGGVLLAGIVALVVFLVRRRSKRAAVSSPPGYPPAQSVGAPQPPLPGAEPTQPVPPPGDGAPKPPM